jgi:hypothetical protein
VPFELCITQGDFRLQRNHASKEEFPFRELIATNGIIPAPLENAEATGIYDLPLHLATRKSNLEQELNRLETEHSPDEVTKDVLRRRIMFLGNPVAARYFNYRMEWVIPLATQTVLHDPDRVLKRGLTSNTWPAYMWMGAWDPDTHCGYTAGCLRIDWAK